jgi:hypothetical protein
MIHLVFNRPTGKLKTFTPEGSLRSTIDATGDAWGDGAHAPYGHNYPIPPGHYRITSHERFPSPIVSEGPGQIYVADIDDATLATLVGAKKASMAGQQVTIGGVSLAIGNLAKYGRSEIMLHGGGSNLAQLSPAEDPLAPMQALCKTHGCTRLHNGDLLDLMLYLGPLYTGHTVVYSVVGDPLKLAM